MFIALKNKSGAKEYINIFKIITIEVLNLNDLAFNTNIVDPDVREQTQIEYAIGNGTGVRISDEPVQNFIRRLKKEVKDIDEIQDRFEILDL